MFGLFKSKKKQNSNDRDRKVIEIPVHEPIIRAIQIAKVEGATYNGEVPGIVVKHILNIWLRYINLIGKPNNIDYFIDFIKKVSLVSRDWLSEILPQLNLSHSEEDTFAISTQRQLNYAFICHERNIRCLKYQINLSLVANNQEKVKVLMPYITDVTNFRLDSHEMARLNQPSKTVSLKEHLCEMRFPFDKIESLQINYRYWSFIFSYDLGVKKTTKALEGLKNLELLLSGPLSSGRSDIPLLELNSLEKIYIWVHTSPAWFDLNMLNTLKRLSNLRHVHLESQTYLKADFVTEIVRGVQNLTTLKVVSGLLFGVDTAVYSLNSHTNQNDSEEMTSNFLINLAKVYRPCLKYLLFTSRSSVSAQALEEFLNETSLEYFRTKFYIHRFSIVAPDESIISNSTLKVYSSRYHHQLWAQSSVRQLRMTGSYQYLQSTSKCLSNHLDTLVHLNIGHVEMGRPHFTTLLSSFIRSTSILKVLRIADCHLDYVNFFSAISENRSIRTLALKKNKIDSSLISQFFKSNHPTITHFQLLRMGNIEISDLLESIINNNTIIHLSLSNSIGSTAFENMNFIKRLFSNNTTLLHLDFSFNPILPPKGSYNVHEQRKEVIEFFKHISSFEHILSLDLYCSDLTFTEEFKSFYLNSSILKICPQMQIKM